RERWHPEPARPALRTVRGSGDDAGRRTPFHSIRESAVAPLPTDNLSPISARRDLTPFARKPRADARSTVHSSEPRRGRRHTRWLRYTLQDFLRRPGLYRTSHPGIPWRSCAATGSPTATSFAAYSAGPGSPETAGCG